MGWNYRKRIRIAPGIYVNYSKTGTSLTLGGHGTSINIGENGTYINQSIPGTGLYRRSKLSNSYHPNQTIESKGCIHKLFILLRWIVTIILLLASFTPIISGFNDSTDVLAYIFLLVSAIIIVPKPKHQNDQKYITKAKKLIEGMEPSIRKDILCSYVKSAPIIEQISKLEKQIEKNEKKLNSSNSLSNLYKKTESLNVKLSVLLNELKSIQYNACPIKCEKDIQQFKNVCETYESIVNSDKKWFISKSAINTEKKSSANTNVKREDAFAFLGSFDNIFCEYNVPIMANKNIQIILYPEIVIIAKNPIDFEIYDSHDVTIKFENTAFIESSTVAKDAIFIKNTWEKVNKDGSPDKRYSDNKQYPVYNYGELIISYEGITNTFMVSNTDSAKSFCEIYNRYHSNIANEENDNEKDSARDSVQNDHYKMALQASENLYEHMKYMYTQKDVLNSLSIPELSALDNINTINGINNRIALLTIRDICTIYEGLGHEIKKDVKEKDSYILYSFVLKTIKSDTNDGSINEAISFINNFQGVIKYDKKRFLLIDLMKSANVNIDIIDKYAILLYRLANAIANLDNTITGTEKKWLANILSYTNDANIGKDSKQHNTTATHNNKFSAEEELNDLIGLELVKEEIKKLTSFIKIQKARENKGLKLSPISYHCVFTGNPGTGKTTVARIIAKIYKDLGILKQGQLIETDRSGLVAEYVGQTAIKTNKIIDSALDGVLFIDEAYSLIQGGNSDFGIEAISTLLKRMEDDRDRLVVILAGYSNEMKDFINSNPGLQSRFNRYIDFVDYNADELMHIFLSYIKNNDYTISNSAKNKIQDIFINAVKHKDANFGNARFVRNVFENTLQNQAIRLASETNISEKMLVEIIEEDIQ